MSSPVDTVFTSPPTSPHNTQHQSKESSRASTLASLSFGQSVYDLLGENPKMKATQAKCLTCFMAFALALGVIGVLGATGVLPASTTIEISFGLMAPFAVYVISDLIKEAKDTINGHDNLGALALKVFELVMIGGLIAVNIVGYTQSSMAPALVPYMGALNAVAALAMLVKYGIKCPARKASDIE